MKTNKIIKILRKRLKYLVITELADAKKQESLYGSYSDCGEYYRTNTTKIEAAITEIKLNIKLILKFRHEITI